MAIASRYIRATTVLLVVMVMMHQPCLQAEPLSEAEVRAFLDDAAPHPRLLMDAPTASRVRARIAESDTAQALFDIVQREADAILEQPPLERKQTGRRLLSVSREVLRRVLCLGFVHRMTYDSRYAERAVAEMEAAAAFSDWNPSHFLDAAEMTAALAIGYDWLHAMLTQEQEAAIRTAILEKGIGPSYEGHNRWVLSDNNWNQVCHGGLIFGALALLEHEPDLAARVIARALVGLPYAMKEYEPDGVYPEGPSYWEYGTSYNVLLIAALESALGTDFGLSETPGFLESGAFPLLMTGPTGAHFNFSDCGARNGPFPAVFWFAQRTRDPGLVWAERPWLEALLEGEAAARNRFLPLKLLWWEDRWARPSQPLHWKGEGINPLATHRSSWIDPNAVFLAVKAGTPAANHGHMDIGTFILDADGARWALDFGAQGYHELEERGMNIWNRNQDSDRWRIYRYHNRSHNTLLVNDAGQVVRGAAPITQFSDNPNFPHTIMDMSDVYAGQLARAERGFALLPDGRVLIQDEIVADDKPARVRWAMTTPAEVTDTAPGNATLRQEEKTLFFEALSPAAVAVEIFATEPPNEWDAPNPGTRQVGFYVELEPQESCTLTVLLTPGSVAASVEEAPAPRPLTQWGAAEE